MTLLTFVLLFPACSKEAPKEATPVPASVTPGESAQAPVSEEDSPPPQDGRALSREEVADLILKDRFEHIAFMSPEDVEYAVGVPEETWEDDDRTYWYYKVMATGPGGPDAGNPEVQFLEGAVRFIVYDPPAAMDDKIATARLNKNWKPFEGERPQTYSFEQAFGLVPAGLTKQEVASALGQPDSRRMMGHQEVWQYEALVVEAGQPHKLAVIFEQGKVLDTQGM